MDPTLNEFKIDMHRNLPPSQHLNYIKITFPVCLNDYKHQMWLNEQS